MLFSSFSQNYSTTIITWFHEASFHTLYMLYIGVAFCYSTVILCTPLTNLASSKKHLTPRSPNLQSVVHVQCTYNFLGMGLVCSVLCCQQVHILVHVQVSLCMYTIWSTDIHVHCHVYCTNIIIQCTVCVYVSCGNVCTWWVGSSCLQLYCG